MSVKITDLRLQQRLPAANEKIYHPNEQAVHLNLFYTISSNRSLNSLWLYLGNSNTFVACYLMALKHLQGGFIISLVLWY